MIFPISELSAVTMGIRLNDSQVTEKVWARFYDEFGYQGSVTLYAFYKQIFQIVYQITGGLLLVFAIFGIIVTIISTPRVIPIGVVSRDSPARPSLKDAPQTTIMCSAGVAYCSQFDFLVPRTTALCRFC